MKQFKNSLSVTGPTSLLKAFAEELRKIGWVNKFKSEPGDIRNILVTYHKEGGVYNFLSGESVNETTPIILPQDWNRALELAAELKEEEFKVGDWVYWSGSNKGVYKITDKCRAFSDSWQVNNDPQTSMCETHLRKATDSEIESYLIKEAEKKGFAPGVKVKISHGTITTITGYKYKKHGAIEKDGEAIILTDLGYCPYSLKSLELLSSTPQITINGYKAEFLEDRVRFGCAEIDKDLFSFISNGAKDPWSGNRGIKYVTIGSGTFTIEQIEEIANHFQSK
jgi:hypothetical protein